MQPSLSAELICRRQIGNARLSGLEIDLNMAGGDYALALSAFFITYCLFEVPSNLMLKKLRPSLWLGSITVICRSLSLFAPVSQC